MKTEKFNDAFAVLLVILIATLWIVQGMGYLNLAGEVVGATIVVFTLVAQHYFRKVKPD